MKKYRKHSIVVIFILAAMITPPDPFTMIFVGIPLIGLYQISIVISAWVLKTAAKKQRLEDEKFEDS